MERFFGTDFSEVRVHNNSALPGLAKDGAVKKGNDVYVAGVLHPNSDGDTKLVEAYTAGNDVAFSPQPGKASLGHEVAHVTQQQEGHSLGFNKLHWGK